MRSACTTQCPTANFSFSSLFVAFLPNASAAAEGRSAVRIVEHATCLGCGCTCDDIAVTADGGRITEARNTCPRGAEWFSDGGVTARITSTRSSSPDIAAALADAVALLRGARRPLVYVAGDLSCETQRAAIALADHLRAALDTLTTIGAGRSTLAGQRRGRVTATLGEIRNRADRIVFWGVDPGVFHPRFTSRYAPDPIGLYVPRGRADRRVLAVDVGTASGPSDADLRLAFTPAEEVAALDLARAGIIGAAGNTSSEPLRTRAAQLAEFVRAGAYTAIVVDGEATATQDDRRSEAVLLLVEASNAATRCVLSTLRRGGNRCGADATLTWQTGFPMAVDFARGTPSYEPYRDAATLLASGEVDVALIVGAPGSVPKIVRTGLLHGVSCIAVGPRASESPFPTMVAIDTGVAGIHERGTVVRMDDVPLPLRPALEAPAMGVYHAQTAARRRTADAELAVATALETDRRPQDSCVVLRVLLATLNRRPSVGHAAPVA